MTHRHDRLLDAALELPCRIFNLGDHATNEFTPPPILGISDEISQIGEIEKVEAVTELVDKLSGLPGYGLASKSAPNQARRQERRPHQLEAAERM